MKRMFFLALLTVAFGSATFARELVAEGKTNSALGDYRIEKADNPVIINGEELKAFIISYQNSPMEVTIVIRKGKDCKNYIVLSDKLSVQYVCNENYFGVEMLDKSLVVEGFNPLQKQPLTGVSISIRKNLHMGKEANSRIRSLLQLTSQCLLQTSDNTSVYSKWPSGQFQFRF